jgi:hypothetical protein
MVELRGLDTQVLDYGTKEILRRAGYRPQQPIQRAAERDEPAIEHWRRHQWPAVKSRAQAGCVDSPTSPLWHV